MIIIDCEKNKLEYDVFSLVKAFYPDEEVNFARSLKTDEKGNISCFKLNFTKEECFLSFKGHDYSVEIDESLKKNIYKNELKKFIYRVLKGITGKELPWGNLTGIRPVKIAMGMLNEGSTREEIADFLKAEHYVSDEKISLGLNIAERENRILSALDYERGYSLYIGIPFCPSRCLYCSFTSNSIDLWKDKVSRYLDCLEKEMDFLKEKYADRVLNTVFVGGGTPTTLSPDELRRLLTMVKEKFDMSHCLELTVEAGRPDSITADKLRVLKELGVTRISVNPQSMNESTLEIIGRKHSVAQTVEAFKLAREEGFDNINMDIIIGLPGEDLSFVQRTIGEIEKLSPDSLTVHSLAIKRASKINEWIEEHGRGEFSDTTEMMKIASEGANRMKLNPYYLYRQKNIAGNLENVGFAAEGKEGIYNILIMEEVQTIVALGAGTVTKRVYPEGRIERCDTVKDVALYMDKIDEMIERKRQLLAD